MASGAAMISQPARPCEGRGGVDLPLVFVVERRLIEKTMETLEDDDDVLDANGGLTVWIDSATVGLGERCFQPSRDTKKTMERVSRVLAQPPPEGPLHMPPPPLPAVLGALMRKIGAYELDLVDQIRIYLARMHEDTYTVGEYAFDGCQSLREVVVPRYIARICICAFRGCTMVG